METKATGLSRRISRRTLLAGGGTVLVGLLAGCGSSRHTSGPARAAAATATAAGTPTADPFFLYLEILTADRPSQYGYIADRGCVPSGDFRQGERMVFRFQILDTAKGTYVTDREASQVVLHLANGDTATGDFKQRGEGTVADAPWTWDICWDVPPTFPIGSLDYYIDIATKEGKSGRWRPPSLIDPSRGIDSRPRIVPSDLATKGAQG